LIFPQNCIREIFSSALAGITKGRLGSKINTSKILVVNLKLSVSGPSL
jgi:hypothetical protein